MIRIMSCEELGADLQLGESRTRLDSCYVSFIYGYVTIDSILRKGSRSIIYARACMYVRRAPGGPSRAASLYPLALGTIDSGPGNESTLVRDARMHVCTIQASSENESTSDMTTPPRECVNPAGSLKEGRKEEGEADAAGEEHRGEAAETEARINNDVDTSNPSPGGPSFSSPSPLPTTLTSVPPHPPENSGAIPSVLTALNLQPKTGPKAPEAIQQERTGTYVDNLYITLQTFFSLTF